MSLHRLFQNLDDLMRTPEDVVQLNAAILDLAVCGKLVPQDARDESARDLLQRLGIKDGHYPRIKAQVTRKHVNLDEPADQALPIGWQMCHAQDICLSINDGDHIPPPKVEAGIPFLVISNIRGGKLDFPDTRFVPPGYCDSLLDVRKPRVGDVLCSIVGSIGTAVLIESDAKFCFQRHLALFRSSGAIAPSYLLCVLKSPSILGQMKNCATGIAQLTVPLSCLRNLAIPLPPLAEQHRIVAKVDELLAQTHALEANLRRAQEEIVVVNQAALHRLETAEDPASLHAAWHTISGVFDLLYDDPRPLAALRQTILQLAVRGKLVRQDQNDESGTELLKRIRAQRIEQLGALSLEPDAEAPVTVFPYSLPNSWTLARLGHLADIQGGVTKGRNLSQFATVVLPYLRVANVQRGYLVLDDVKDIEVKTEEQDKYALQVGDLLLTEGGDADKLGRTAIWRGEILNCIHQNHIFRARLTCAELLPDWFMLYLNSGFGQSYFLGSAKQTTNLATINMRQLRSCPIPIPPFKEQRRIVAKVDELLGMCDALERQLDRSAAAQKAAVASVLAHLPQQR